MPALMAEIRACLRLATPIVLAQLAMMGSRVADTIMAGRLSATDLAAVASGSSYWMILGLLVIGLANGLSPIVAQQRGGGEVPERIGHYLQQCLWVAVVVGVVLLVLMQVTAAPLMQHLGLSEQGTASAAGYLRAVSLGSPAFAVMLVLRFGADGMGETRPFLLVGIIGLLVNVLLNYILMWGAAARCRGVRVRNGHSRYGDACIVRHRLSHESLPARVGVVPPLGGAAMEHHPRLAGCGLADRGDVDF